MQNQPAHHCSLVRVSGQGKGFTNVVRTLGLGLTPLLLFKQKNMFNIIKKSRVPFEKSG